MLNATRDRLDVLFKELLKEDADEEAGLPVKVPLEARNYLWTWFDPFQDLYENFEDRGHKLTNKQFRNLRGTLKKIGRVDFTNFKERIRDICKALVDIEPVFS